MSFIRRYLVLPGAMKGGSAAAGKRSGVPNARASDAAERSPAVYFANLKADMLFQKQMQVLKRAERSFIHCIVIDQKILFRRFQAKLRRSKIARARLWGDKDTERQLRASDLHVMNSNCGQEQDDLEFLKKLQQRPCIVEDLEEVEKKAHLARKAPEITDEDMEALIRAVMEEQVPPLAGRTMQSLSNIGHLLEEAQFYSSAKPMMGGNMSKSRSTGGRKVPKIIVRPVTISGPRADAAKDNSLLLSPQKSSMKIRSSRAWHCNLLASSMMKSEQNQEITPSHVPSDMKKNSVLSQNKARPLTSPAVMASQGKSTKTSELQTLSTCSAPVNDNQKTPSRAVSSGCNSILNGSRRQSQATTSMFEEQQMVDLVALRLEEVRKTDPTPKVNAFLKTLLDMDRKKRGVSLSGTETAEEDVGHDDKNTKRVEESKGDRKFDYYATKMALEAASVKKDLMLQVPGTPEEVNLRLVGDQNIKSITMPRLCLDFMSGNEKENKEPNRSRTINTSRNGSRFHQGTPNILSLE